MPIPSDNDTELIRRRRERSGRRFVARRLPPALARAQAPAGLRESAPRAPVVRRDRLVRRLLAVSDVVSASIALLLVMGPSDLRPVSGLLPLTMVVVCKTLGLYDRDEAVMRRSTLEEVPRLAEIAGLAALIFWLLSDLFVVGEPMRVGVVAIWLTIFVGMVVLRGLARALARSLASAERCAIVGDVHTIGHVTRKLAASRVKADVIAALRLDTAGNSGTLPTTREFGDWLDGHRVERLVVAPFGSDSSELLDLIRVAKAAGVRVSLLPRLLEVVGSSVVFEDVDGMTVLGVRSFGLTRSSRNLKRGFDLIGAGVGVLAVAPLLLALGLAIKLTSRGPVFFEQQRVGRGGHHFGMLKFRSMVDDAEAMKAGLLADNETDGLFKLTDDPRVTRVGRVLRATSLDELPQLFNVLRGEMSLVGPRPLVIEEDALVGGLDRARLHLTPGMTGPWQVLGGTRVPLREMVSIDYLYVVNWSLWRDVEILVRTVAHVMRRSGV